MAATPGACHPVLSSAAADLLGDLIGPGGAESRLPLLIGVFGSTCLLEIDPLHRNDGWADVLSVTAKQRVER